MASKTFFRNFGDFKGLDLYQSLLSAETTFATKFQNCEMHGRKSIRKRPGFKMAAQFTFQGDSTPKVLGTYSGFLNNGTVLVNELVGSSGNSFHRLVNGSCVITGPANSTFSFLPSATSSDWIADCLVNGVSVGGAFPLACNINHKLSALKAAIEGIGGGGVWTCVLTPSAVVSGAQAGRDHANPVVVADTHTLSVATYYPAAPRIEVMTTAGISVWADIIEIAAGGVGLSNIRLKTSEPFAVADGAQIGVGLYQTQILPITEATACAAGLILSFKYWENVFAPTAYTTITKGNRAATFKNLSNVLFWRATYAGYSYYGGIYKYDGREVCHVGIGGNQTIPATLPAAGAGLGIGRYKYLQEFIRTDAAGNEIHSNATDLVGEAYSTTTAGNQQIRVTVVPPTTSTFFLAALGHHGAVITAAAGPTNTVTVAAATNTLRLGDWVYFKDSATGVTLYRQVTALTDTSVTFSGDPFTVSNAAPNQFISNIISRYYRTTVGGSFYYKLDDWPIPYTLAFQSIVDALPDANLGELWEGPFLGQDRRDVPPPMALIEEHQGLLVGIGDQDEPNTLRWSNYDSPEYWSSSTNYQPIPTAEGGVFTALASDSIDTLILFKDTSFKVVQGDLFSGGFSLTNEPKGDVGCPSSRGWIKARGAIFFQSNGGPRMIVGGELQTPEDRLYTDYFQKDWRTDLANGIVALDVSNGRIWIFNTNHQNYSLDVVHNLWNSVKFNSGYFYIAAAEWNDDFYVVDQYATNISYGSLWVRNKTETKYDYIDTRGNAIDQDFYPQWDCLGDPTLNKEFLKAIIWSVDNSLFVPSSLTIETFRNWSNLAIDSTISINFAAATEMDKEFPLILNRAKALQFRFRNNVRLECPHISGYEVEISLPYKKEHLSLKDS